MYYRIYILLFISFFLIHTPLLTLGRINIVQENGCLCACKRDGLPNLQKIDGVWVSDIYCTDGFSGLPFYILIIRDGKVKLDMLKYGYVEKLVSNASSKMPKEECTIAQSIVNIDESSLYVAWSNEKLKVPNQDVALGLGQIGGDVAHTITKHGTSELFGDSFIGEIGSDLVSGVVSGIISGLIMDAFTPSKKINVLEMTIQQNNEYELTGHALIQEINIKGESEPSIMKREEIIHFTKYEPDSGVFFDIPFENKIYVPGDGLLKEIPKRYQKIGKAYIRYYDLKVPTHISNETLTYNYPDLPSSGSLANPFNVFQIKKLHYYNEQRLLNSGYNHSVSKAYLGALMEERVDKKGNKGCNVYKVLYSSPAYLFGIQKGDIILSIDGFELESPEQAEMFIESLKPFEWVSILLKRGKKTINIDVEMSKQ